MTAGAAPCDSCTALCCRSLLLPVPPPRSAADLDRYRFLVNFEGARLVWWRGGSFGVEIERTCRHLEQATGRCLVHGTDEQPDTCKDLDAHRCWYRSTLDGEPGDEVVRLDHATLPLVLDRAEVDERGVLVRLPRFDDVRDELRRLGGSSRPEAYVELGRRSGPQR